MSAERAVLPERARPTEPPARRLRALDSPARRRRPKLVYALSALLLAGLLAAAQVTLTLATTQDSFVLADLRAEQRELTLQTQALQTQLTGLSSPQYLAANADALGMVVVGTPAHLRLSDAAVIGSAATAGADSSVHPNGQASIGNALVADTPLITAPESTITGTIPVTGEELNADEGAVEIPPALTEGLPSPRTR